MQEEKKVEEMKHEEKETITTSLSETTPEIVKEKTSGVKISTKMAVIIAAVIILLALAFYYRGFFIAATVNGSPISRFAVMSEAEKQSGKTVLDNMILKKIIREEAQKQKIRVTKADITEEIKKLEEQLKNQNTTLEEALASQGLTRASLEEQIALQKQVEKMTEKGPDVTSDEVEAYIKSNKITVPKGSEVEYRAQIKSQLEQQSFSKDVQKMVDDLKAKASINYFVKY